MSKKAYITSRKIVNAIKLGGGLRTIAKRLGVSTHFLYYRARKDWRVYHYLITLRCEYRKYSKNPIAERVIHGE